MQAIPTALTQSLKAWDWRPLAYERNLTRNYKIAGKIVLLRKFLKAIPTALTQSLKAWDWRPLAYERNLTRNYKIAGKIVLLRKFLKAIPTALTQSLKDRDWRPLACERKLFRNYKNRWQKFPAPKIFESDSHDAHSEPQGLGLAPFGIRTEFI